MMPGSLDLWEFKRDGRKSDPLPISLEKGCRLISSLWQRQMPQLILKLGVILASQPKSFLF